MRDRAVSRQKLLDSGEQTVGIAEPEDVLAPWQFHILRARNVGGEEAALGHGGGTVVDAMDHQCRHGDDRQHLAHVAGQRHPQKGAGRRGTGASMTRAVPPVSERGGVRDLRCGQAEIVEVRGRTRGIDKGFDNLVKLGCGQSRAKSHRRLGERVDQDERLHSIGESRREHDRDRADLARGKHCHALRADRVEHGQRIMCPLLQCRGVRQAHWIGQSDATEVETDEPAERGQTMQEPSQRRLLHHRIHGDKPDRHHEHVQGASAENLIRQMQAVGGLGVFRFWQTHHGGLRRPVLLQEQTAERDHVGW